MLLHPREMWSQERFELQLRYLILFPCQEWVPHISETLQRSIDTIHAWILTSIPTSICERGIWHINYSLSCTVIPPSKARDWSMTLGPVPLPAHTDPTSSQSESFPSCVKPKSLVEFAPQVYPILLKRLPKLVFTMLHLKYSSWWKKSRCWSFMRPYHCSEHWLVWDLPLISSWTRP